MTIVAQIDEPPAAAQLAAAIANVREYHAKHPTGGYHLEIMLGALLAALQAYANAATDETIRAVLREVVDGEQDDETDDDPPPVHAQRVMQ